jgi:hypothetical protein
MKIVISLDIKLSSYLKGKTLRIRYRAQPSSGMLRRVAVVRTEVSEEPNVSIIRATRIGELGTTLTISSNYLVFLFSMLRLLVTANVVLSSSIIVTLMMEALGSSKRLFLQEPHGVTFQKTAFFITF